MPSGMSNAAPAARGPGRHSTLDTQVRAPRHLTLESGLTLFEVLIAAAVLGMVFLGLLAAMGDSFLANRAAYASTRSQNLAKCVMEETLQTTFDNLLSLDGDTVTQDGFTATVHVLESTADLRLIEVTVAKAGTHTGTTRLLTYRCKR